MEPEMRDGPTLPGRAGWQHGSSGVQEEGRASEPRGPARILQLPARGSGQRRPVPTWILAHFNPSWTSHPQHHDLIRLCLSEPRSLWAFVAAEVGNQRSRYPRVGRGGFLRACVRRRLSSLEGGESLGGLDRATDLGALQTSFLSGPLSAGHTPAQPCG